MIYDQARTLIEKYYIDSTGNGVTLDVSMRPDFGSLLAQLDSSAEVLSWKQAVRFYNPFRAGTGVFIRSENGETLITAVIPDSPASHAGLKPGDRIIRIDDDPIDGKSPMNVIAHLVGAPGSEVNVTVASLGGETRELKLTRMVMDADPAVGERIIEKDMGYLRIGAFDRTTAEEVKNAMKGLIREGTSGLIIDLRGNTGHSDEEAAQTVQLFLKEGSAIGRLHGRMSEFDKTYVSQGWTHYTDIPLVILIDEATSSGAELFAAAMHDNGRSRLVGARTAGYGAMLSSFQLKDGSYLLIRTGSYEMPSGGPIEGHGIVPDVVVDLSPEEKDEAFRTTHSHRMWREDIPGDKQLCAAISVLRGRVMSAAQGVQ